MSVKKTFRVGILDLLSILGLNKDELWLLVRHQHHRYPAQTLLRNGWFELYQAYQKRPVFHKSNVLITLYGTAGSRARFHGVYNREDILPSSKGPTPDNCPWAKEWQGSCKYFYVLNRDSRFTELEHRVIIDWGPSTRSWYQRKDKQVLEIVEPGRVLPPFSDYLEFSLSFEQLRTLFDSPSSHREWKAQLSAVAGIYLILAQTTGDLYVGSAYGDEGIWGRWRAYATNGDGGNAQLQDLIRRDSSYPAQFRFSVLQILPKTLSHRDVIQRESDFKLKLGSRARGLNLN